jgi:hypothetical protein
MPKEKNSSCSLYHLKNRIVGISRWWPIAIMVYKKYAVIRERIERFSQNVTHTNRKLVLSWGSTQNLCCLKSKMAADHHIGVRHNTIIRNLAHRFSRTLTFRCGKIFFYTGDVQYQSFANSRWRSTAMLDFHQMP